MKITLDITKTPEQNSAVYYEKAKKAKRKLEGVEKALEQSRKKMQELLQKKDSEERKAEVAAKEREKRKDRKWFEKFRWFVSSEGVLVVGGRDATTNEIIIKKHTETGDLVFHTDMAGSPFFVVKTEGKKPGDETILEASIATASFSRAWRLGLSVLEVFHVNPDQVSKTAKSGEYMGKGAFMIYGKTSYITAELKLAIGVDSEGRVMCGPPAAVKKNCGKCAEVMQGRDKTSDTAKKIKRAISGELDDIIAALPSGGCRIKS